jgi:hypothetical protein
MSPPASEQVENVRQIVVELACYFELPECVNTAFDKYELTK